MLDQHWSPTSASKLYVCREAKTQLSKQLLTYRKLLNHFLPLPLEFPSGGLAEAFALALLFALAASLLFGFFTAADEVLGRYGLQRSRKQGLGGNRILEVGMSKSRLCGPASCGPPNSLIPQPSATCVGAVALELSLSSMSPNRAENPAASGIFHTSLLEYALASTVGFFAGGAKRPIAHCIRYISMTSDRIQTQHPIAALVRYVAKV